MEGMTDTRQDAGAPPAAPAPRLTRSRGQKVIGGVCGGLGRHYDLDPVIFRVVLGVLSVTGGLGLVAYGFAWLLMPLEGEEESEGRRLLSGRVEGQALTALLFAVVGCGLFLSMLGRGTVHFFAALLLLCAGGAAYWSKHRREAESGESAVDEATAQTVADAPPETAPPPVPRSPSWWRDPLTKDGAAHGDYLWGPDDEPHDEEEAEAGSARRAPGRSGIGGWIWLAAVCAGVNATGAVWGSPSLGDSLAMGLACALGVFGLGFVLSAWYGRAGGGTAFWALLTTVLLVGALCLPDSITASWSRRTWQPATAAQLQGQYELGSGEAALDLRNLELRDGQRVAAGADVGLGTLTVTVPRDVRTVIRGELGIGELRLPGDGRSGDADFVARQQRSVILEPSGGGEASGTLLLDLEVFMGKLEVNRAAP